MINANRSVVCLRESVINPAGNACQAVLEYQSEGFLPSTFALTPIACDGFQQARVDLPQAIPNGHALITWYVELLIVAMLVRLCLRYFDCHSIGNVMVAVGEVARI